jgi:hypothetical protein
LLKQGPKLKTLCGVLSTLPFLCGFRFQQFRQRFFGVIGDDQHFLFWSRFSFLAGRNIDYLAIHHYYGRRELGGDPLNLMARPLAFERFYTVSIIVLRTK